MPNPDYATLLPLIAAETDPTARQALIDQAYQFLEPLTQAERDLFAYLPDGYVSDVDNDYSFFTEYVGGYYNAEGEDTLAQRVATQKLRVTSITKAGDPAVEGDVDGTYTCTIEADEPLSIPLTFTVAIYGRGGDISNEVLLGSNLDETIGAGLSNRVSNVSLSTADSGVMSDIFTNSNFELRARVFNIRNTQTFADAQGDDFIIPLAEVATTFTVTPTITISSTTATSSVFDVSFDSNAFPTGSLPKQTFSVNATVTTGANVYNFTNVLQIQANSNNVTTTGQISIPQGTNFYNTPGNLAEIQLVAVGNTGYENLVFATKYMTTLENTLKTEFNTMFSTYDVTTDVTTVLGAITGAGYTPIAVVRDGNISESLSGLDPLNGFGFNLPAFDNATNLGLSSGFTQPQYNGKREMLIAAFDSTGYVGILSMLFHGNNGTNDATVVPTTIPQIFTIMDGPAAQNDVTATRWVMYAVAYNYRLDETVEDDTGTTLWQLSDGQNPTADGYYGTNRLSFDDGFWGLKIGGNLQGNEGTSVVSTDTYGIGNMNNSDINAQSNWGNTTLSTTNTSPYMYIFTR